MACTGQSGSLGESRSSHHMEEVAKFPGPSQLLLQVRSRLRDHGCPPDGPP